MLNCGFFTFKEIDRGLIEIFGPLGLVKLIQILKVKFNKLQTGFLHHYAFIMVSSVTFILIIFVLLNFIYYFQFDFRFFIIYIFTILFIINNNKIFNT